MKSKGIARRIDPLGRVVIPKEIRRVMGIADGDSLEIIPGADGILLRPTKNCCSLCGGMSDLILSDGKALCQSCYNKFTAVTKK